MTAMSKHMFIGSYVLVLLVVFPASAFLDTPLTESQEAKFKEELAGKKLAQLDDLLESETHTSKVGLVLDELGKRGGDKARNILEQFDKETALALEKSGARDVVKRILRARALVNLARVKAGRQDSRRYIAELERLLSKGEQSTQEAVAVELGRVGSKQAGNVLAKYANRRGISPLLRMERLRVDYWHLSNEEFVKAILEEVRAQIIKGDKPVAEGSILMQRGINELLAPSLLDPEINSPSLDSETYLDFLRKIRERLQVVGDRYHPGSSLVLELYNKRDSSVLDALKKIYVDRSLNWRYRDKAYELFLTMELERLGLNSTETAVEYLLSKLTGTGGAHSSDWQDNNKTLEAINNAGVIATLVKYGRPALSLIDKELEGYSGTENEYRQEALRYIKKRIGDGVLY
jgi:hypothetical protein